jgi:hypothetical protein
VQGRPDARNQAVKNYKRLHFARWVPLQGWEQRGSSSQHKRSPHRRPRRGRSCWDPDVGPPLNPRHPVAVAWCPARSQEFGPIRTMPGWPSGNPVECQPELPRLHPRPLECVESIYIGFASPGRRQRWRPAEALREGKARFQLLFDQFNSLCTPRLNPRSTRGGGCCSGGAAEQGPPCRAEAARLWAR